MKKLIAFCAVSGGIALLTGACAEQPPEPPMRAGVSKPMLGVSTWFNNAGQCLGNDAVTWADLVPGLGGVTMPGQLSCNASDIRVVSAVATQVSFDGVNWSPVGGAITCNQGDLIWLRMAATLENVAADRYDAGLYIATDGGNAKAGSCNHYNLPVSPLKPGTTNLDGDSCGDLAPASSTVVDSIEVTTICAAGQSGQLEISMCTEWTSAGDTRECPEPTVSGANGFRAGTLPGTVSKCNCQPIVIQTTPTQGGSITIIKDAVPDDPQDFSFTLTSGQDALSFDLDDDADPTLEKSATFSGLAAGTYTVAEVLSPSFDLTSITCTTGGLGNRDARTATIDLAAGANVTCTFQNAKRATIKLNKRENGALPLTRAWGFEVRINASTSQAGTVVASGVADLSSGIVNFDCTSISAHCESVGGIANLLPTTYQLCEVGMPAGYTNNITSPPGFTPAGSTAEGGANAAECMNITLLKADAGVPAGVPNPIDNAAPPATGGSITLGTGSFTLVNDALSGSFLIRNSSMGSQQVFVTSLTIVNATFRDGSNLVQASVTGCTFTPLPVLIPASASQTITLANCHVAPSVRKELMFTVRATINGGDQPFYDRTYKVRTQ